MVTFFLEHHLTQISFGVIWNSLEFGGDFKQCIAYLSSYRMSCMQLKVSWFIVKKQKHPVSYKNISSERKVQEKHGSS